MLQHAVAPLNAAVSAIPSNTIPFLGLAANQAVTPGWVSLAGKAAPMAAMVVFLSPWPTIKQISKDKTVGDLPLTPYSSMVSNCLLWLSYGILKQESKVWSTNLIGLGFGFYYLYQFVRNSSNENKKFHLSAIQAILALSVVIATTVPNAATVIGNLAVLLCIVMFASPLSTLKKVIETKNADSIPLPFTLATITNCLLWSISGLLEMKDAFIYVPNILGLSCGLAQLTLKTIFRKKIQFGTVTSGGKASNELYM